MFALIYTKLKEQYIHIDMDPTDEDYQAFIENNILGDYIKNNDIYINSINDLCKIYLIDGEHTLKLEYNYGYSDEINFTEQQYQEILTYPGQDNAIKAINYCIDNNITGLATTGIIFAVRER